MIEESKIKTGGKTTSHTTQKKKRLLHAQQVPSFQLQKFNHGRRVNTDWNTGAMWLRLCARVISRYIRKLSSFHYYYFNSIDLQRLRPPISHLIKAPKSIQSTYLTRKYLTPWHTYTSNIVVTEKSSSFSTT